MTAGSWIAVGSSLGALGVIAGAFGAHALEDKLTADAMDTFEKAVRYHLIHAVALVLVGLLIARQPSAAAAVAAWAFLVGIVLFSGCLYAWVLSGFKPLVHVVPFGGTAFVVGWIALAVAGFGWQASANLP